jgi:hypothetical protein
MQVIFASYPSYKDMTFRLCALSGVILATTLILFPALIAYQKKKYIASAVATLVLVPFVIFANIHEYVLPYRGGGASMAYFVVFFFGMPLSIVLMIISIIFEKNNG